MSDEFRNLIESMFQQKKEEKKEKTEDKPKDTKFPTYRLDFPESPPKTKEENNKAIKYAKEEMERIRLAFLDFTEKVNDTVLYGHLYGDIEDFVEVCKDLTTMLEDGIDKDKLTSHGLEDYERMVRIRERLLSYVLDKYEEKD